MDVLVLLWDVDYRVACRCPWVLLTALHVPVETLVWNIPTPHRPEEHKIFHSKEETSVWITNVYRPCEYHQTGP